jgi:hypothetical protein
MLHISVSIYGGDFVGGQILGGPSPLPNQFMVEGLCRSLFIPGKSIYAREVYLYPGGLFIPGRSIYTSEVYLYLGSLFIPGRSIYTSEVYLYPGSLFIPRKSIYTSEPTM